MNQVVLYAYLIRVPLVISAVLAAVGPLAIVKSSPARSLLEGLFDLDNGGVFLTASFAFLCVAAATIVSDLVFDYGQTRFGIASLPRKWQDDIANFGGFGIGRATVLVFSVYFAAAVILVGCTTWYPQFSLAKAGAAAAGVAVVFAVICATAFIWRRLPPGIPAVLTRVLRWTPAGFLDPLTRALLPGHSFALLMLLVSLLVFVYFGIGGALILTRDVRVAGLDLSWLFRVPTLASAVILLILLCWGLAGLAFLLDRIRIPLLIPLALLWTFTAQFQSSDHYYDIRPQHYKSATRPALYPAEALRITKGAPVTVIAAEGGGIQAAAWTARVLTGIVDDMQAETSRVAEFARSVRLVSAVSGGSVGALYFVAAFEGEGNLNAREFRRQVLEPARASSLDAVAWGLVYRDLFRSMFPFLISNKHDRGWATERAWSRFGVFHNGLAEWRQDAKRGIRPAVVFNGTVAETGERFLMGTIDPLPSGGVDGADRAGTAVGRRTFHETYYPNDIHPVTAARLSANFPYVSPASRINYWVPKSKRLHIVDGGYYDNYGVSTAAELLDQATKGLKSRGSTPLNRILLIEIAGAESVTADAARTTAPNSCEEDTDMSREPLNKAGNRGWFFQTFAPLKTMFEVRSTGQRSHNETEIGLLAETLNGRGILLQRVRFTFPCQQTPLSWHLTEVQKNNIDRAWQTRYAADVKSQELKAVTCHIAIPGAKSKEEFLACLKD